MLNRPRNGRFSHTVGEFYSGNPFLQKISNKKTEVSYFQKAAHEEIINKASHPNSQAEACRDKAARE
jgi:hypothetical protein